MVGDKDLSILFELLLDLAEVGQIFLYFEINLEEEHRSCNCVALQIFLDQEARRLIELLLLWKIDSVLQVMSPLRLDLQGTFTLALKDQLHPLALECPSEQLLY